MIVTAEHQNRFWSKVQKSETCWKWTGCLSSNGRYGSFRIDGKMLAAHRVAYRLAYGIDPGTHHVLHQCDNPICVRPDHLFLGTHADNMADMAHKNRAGRVHGSRHGKSRVTEEMVRQIRQLEGTMTQIAVAKRFGISQPTVDHIWKRRTWNWL